MGEFRAPGNPVKKSISKVHFFEGIGGPEGDVLRRTNSRGWDISNTVANIVQDLNLVQQGAMRLRDGTRKIDSTGLTAHVTALFPFRLGQRRAFAFVTNGALSVVDMPRWLDEPQEPFDFTPAPPAVTLVTEYPLADVMSFL